MPPRNLERARKGEKNSMAAGLEDRDALYRAYAPQVLRLLLTGFTFARGTGDRGFMRVASTFDAEEICQEAFVAFFQQVDRKTFDASRPVLPYLLRIAVNLALQRQRKQVRELIVEDPQPMAPDFVDEPARREAARLLGELRSQLDLADQPILDEAFEAGVSQRALGERLGLSRDQVYRAMQRVRGRAWAFFSERGWFA